MAWVRKLQKAARISNSERITGKPDSFLGRHHRCAVREDRHQWRTNQKANGAASPRPYCDSLIWTGKSAVLNSLSSSGAQRGYRHAIDEFIDWYCSEPRLSFSKSVVLRYRIHLESRCLAPGTINLRLGAVRRLAYETSDCGLLSPDLVAGIRRVKGVKKTGVRLGNWLTRNNRSAYGRHPTRLA